jgi:RND family efflux transporter MFP subunit
VLAQLQTETLEIELAAAEAELELYQQQLAALENGSRPEDIAEAEANMRGAEAAVKNAANKLQRAQSLATTRAASASDLDDAVAQSDAAKFAFQATEALLARIKEGPRTETIAQAHAQVELQKQRRNLLKDRIEKFTITAPFDGFVSAEFTEVGAWIARGDPIAEVIQMDQVEIEAPVTAESVVGLRKGDPIRVEFPELPDELFMGSVSQIVPVAELRTRTFPVLVKLNNTIRDGTPMLLAGMFARVELPAGQRQLLPLVPKDSLVLNGNERSVFIVDLDAGSGSGNAQTGTVRKVSVELGVAVNQRIQIRGDIHVGDLVVVIGNERLIPNSHVKIIREVEPATK